ncbi:MAG: peptide-methionine (R)-S-oxide reductase MsrB [Bacteroidetes bacterium]|nr:peptide-methionine (R)-S-oxide reductase MsrB [Bacteroidota bacterium]
MKSFSALFLFSFLLISCNQAQKINNDSAKEKEGAIELFTFEGDTIQLIEKSKKEWKASLTDDEYAVLCGKGTEMAFTGKYNKHKGNGIYTCAACDLPLFSSKTKYDSGSGWPSFYQPIGKQNVAEEVDNTLGVKRTEILCARCGGHLGHVFDDGPRPTGLRYCVNSISLDFIKKQEEEKKDQP